MKQKIIYAIFVNIYHVSHILELRWDATLESWWDKSGDYDVKKLGYDMHDSHFTFASVEKKEVEKVYNAIRTWRRYFFRNVTHDIRKELFK